MQATLSDVLPRVAMEPPVETQTVPLDSEPTLAARELQGIFRDQQWQIRIELSNDPAQSEWLSMSDQASDDPHVIEIRVSMAHPFMVQLAQTDPDAIEAILRVAAALGLAEKLARSTGVKMAKTIRRNFNEILREALSSS
jgi:hypothetical protein